MLKSKNSQKIIAFTLAYLVSFPAIAYAITNLVAVWKIPIISSVATPIMYTSFYILLVIALFHAVPKMSGARLAVVAFMVFSLLVAWMNDKDNSQYMWTRWDDLLYNPAYTFWLCSFSAFLLSAHIRDIEVLAKVMERFSYVTILLALLQYFVALNRDTQPEYMTFSYNIVFATAYLLVLYINQAGWKRLLIGLIGSMLIFIAGCRGALVSLIISVVISLLFVSKRMSAQRVVFIAALMIMCMVIWLFGQDIIDGLVKLVNTLGIESRTIEKIASASFLEDSGRSELITECLNNLEIFGLGLYGDRVLLSGRYPHNIAVEVLVDYGIIIGTIILLILILVIVKGFRGAQGYSKMMICALIASGVIKLCFSGSFLNQEASFYLLLGLCLDNMRASKKMIR